MRKFIALTPFFLILFACSSGANQFNESDNMDLAQSPGQIKFLYASTKKPSKLNLPDPLAACRQFKHQGLQFFDTREYPNSPQQIPSEGIVKVAVLFLDFEDAPATDVSTEDLILPHLRVVEEYFSSISRNRLGLVFNAHFEWIRMGNQSTYYEDMFWSGDETRLFQEAISLSDKEVDFSNVESIILITNPDAAIQFSHSFLRTLSQGGVYGDGSAIFNGIVLGRDFPIIGSNVMAHEIGHSLGLVDLYEYGSQSHPAQFVGYFGLMGSTTDQALELFAYERWLLNWFDDDQMDCLEAGELTTTLFAVETDEGLKAVMIPIGPTKVLIIESRRNMRYDSGLIKSGVLVYLVNTQMSSGRGPIEIFPKYDDDPFRHLSPLGQDETITIEGVTITVLGATETSDTVQITISE